MTLLSAGDLWCYWLIVEASSVADRERLFTEIDWHRDATLKMATQHVNSCGASIAGRGDS